ncbi:MAG: hypothetical protein DMG98_10080, partial [Acidobacteria bacterium]
MRAVSVVTVLVVCLASIPGRGQDANALDITRLSRELDETRRQLAESQKQVQQLRQDVDELRQQLRGLQLPAEATTVAAADQDPSFLAAKIAELHQDKVESTSKYPVRVSGLVLFNSYVNRGSVSAADVPVLAFPRSPGIPNGSIGATVSQTLLGISVKGPVVLGARTSADASIDFSGGNPPVSYGVTAGLIRLRTANAHIDWSNTSLKIGQDAPFFSPLSPTSYATVAEPSFSWAGNLWVWTPQVEVEHRIALNTDSSLTFQGGLLDPLTEESASFQFRSPSAGELSRVPAIAGRVAWARHSASTFPFTLGLGGYRARQQYGSFPDLNSWTVNADFDANISTFIEVSGEWYRGQAVGGLGGGIWMSVIYPNSAPPYSGIHALRSTGGWAQLKVRPTQQWEFNGAIGQDENDGKDLRFFPTAYASYGFSPFQKNAARFVNAIYRPRAS